MAQPSSTSRRTPSTASAATSSFPRRSSSDVRPTSAARSDSDLGEADDSGLRRRVRQREREERERDTRRAGARRRKQLATLEEQEMTVPRELDRVDRAHAAARGRYAEPASVSSPGPPDISSIRARAS